MINYWITKKCHLKELIFKDTDDAEFIDEIMNVLGDEVKEVDSFLIVYKYKDRFTRPFKRTLTMITKGGNSTDFKNRQKWFRQDSWVQK